MKHCESMYDILVHSQCTISVARFDSFLKVGDLLRAPQHGTARITQFLGLGGAVGTPGVETAQNKMQNMRGKA